MKYIEKDAAIQFCDKVLGTDTVYSPEVKNAFKAYKAYLDSLATVRTCSCVKCIYATERETIVGTIRYECMFDKGWRDKEGCCENGRERQNERVRCKDGNAELLSRLPV